MSGKNWKANSCEKLGPTKVTVKIPAWMPHPKDSGDTILAHEILAERASSMGAAAERVEKALKTLHASAPDAEDQPALQKSAADAVWSYFVQRELCGFRRHDDVIRDLGIPKSVLNRLGAR